MEDLKQFLTLHRAIFNIDSFENEFEIIKQIQEKPKKTQCLFRKLFLVWFKNLRRKEALEGKESRIKKSHEYREEGNKLYLLKGKDRKLLDACGFYTRAILIAPPHTEELALAHANRGMALQEFGYYMQAYDDCVCALENGYPERLLHKILIRQAFCAWKMGDIAQLKLHIESLDKLQININFIKQKEELRTHLLGMINQKKGLDEENICQSHEIELKRDKQKIVDSNSAKGRFLMVTEKFKKNEIIFSERATSFLPVKDFRICHECANTQLIPFPCYECYGQVVYCSIKCRNAHKKLHEFECPGIQTKFFENIGIGHLATRIVIENLPKVIAELEQKRNAKGMWLELIDGGSIAKSETNGYGETLRLRSILATTMKHELNDIICFAMIANMVVFFLKKFTKFFDLFPIKKVPAIEWEIITGALTLRHIGQMMMNAHTVDSILMRPSKQEDELNFPLLIETFWCGPYRIKLGQLHNFSFNDVLAAVNIPYLSLCNHSCQQLFQPKFSGRYMCAYALRDIKPNEEIFNCYVPDYRKSKKIQRSHDLFDRYMFICKCQKCSKSKPDEDYEHFHRYRCQVQNCRKEFSPNLLNLPNLNWWLDESTLTAGINCTFCGKNQFYIWLAPFLNDWLRNAKYPAIRRMLYKTINDLDEWLIGYNQLKSYLALCTLRECVDAHFESAFLEDDEFKELVNIVKYLLKATAAQNYTNSIEYCTTMTYLWDFIALGKVKCSDSEMQEMLEAIEILSNEYKRIFMNYYEDFIKDKVT